MRLRGDLRNGTRYRSGGSSEFDPLGGLPYRSRRTWSLEHRGGGASRFGALLCDLVDEGEDLRCIASLFWLFPAPFDRLGWKGGLWERVKVVQNS